MELEVVALCLEQFLTASYDPIAPSVSGTQDRGALLNIKP